MVPYSIADYIMNVDDMLKTTAVPAKRKLQNAACPNEIYKLAKISDTNSRANSQVTEEHSDRYDSATNEAGPVPAPDDQRDDYDRFFGGGITKFQEHILDYVSEQEHATTISGNISERIDLSWLKRRVHILERHIAVNSELRARHAQDPQKFILSEADLDADIRALSVVSEHPDLYAHVVELGCLGQLVGLLSHENTDISIGSIVIIAELTDDDTSANNEQWQGLAEAMLNADLIGLLLSNFDRFDERDEADRTGLYSGLSILENLCSQRSTCEYLAQHDDLLRWLLKRIQRPEDTVSQNTQYAAEVLALMAQSSERSCNHLIKIDAIDQLLQLVAPYRKHAPFKNGDEAEYVENLFETLVCLVDRPDGNVKFVDAEGLELCLIMLKEGGVCKQPALRLLDHAIGGVSAGHVSQRLVQAGGLKVIFTAFMKRDDGRTMPHILAVMASLLRLLPADSAERIRTLAKFVERDYEKLRKLIRLRRFYATKLADNEKHIEAERRTRLHAQNEFGALDSAADLEPEMLHAGLFPLQMINVLLAWLTVEDDGACCMIQELLVPQEQGQGQALNSIKSSLISQVEALISNGQDRTEMKDMLAALIECMPS